MLVWSLLLGAAPPEVVELKPEVRPEAPSPDVDGLSIEDALRIAIDTSEAITAAQAGTTRARGEALRAGSDWYPQVGAAASYQHTFLSEYDQVFVAPDRVDEAPGTPASIPLDDLPFGRDDTWRLDLSLSQTVWAGGRRTAQGRIADAGEVLAALEVGSARAEVALDAARAYYDALLADRLLTIARDTLAQSETTLDHTRLAVEVGAQAEFEALRAQVDADNQRVTVLEQERARDAALLRLRLLLDLDADAPLELTTRLSEAPDEAIGAAPERISAVDPLEAAPEDADEARVVVRQAEQALVIAQAAQRIARSQRLPQLAATSQLGWVAYPDTPLPPVDTDEWRTNFTVGGAVQVPVFTGFRVRGDLLVAEADVAQARADLDRARELAALDTADALSELDAAQARWEATTGTVNQAERAYAIAEIRFAQGIAPQVELADARLLLQQALANRARAARDLQLARIRVALLPALPPGASLGAPP